eukprot:1365884-Rhodomonas_salina.1
MQNRHFFLPSPAGTFNSTIVKTTIIVTFLSSGHVYFLLMSVVEALDDAIHAIATTTYTAASSR